MRGDGDEDGLWVMGNNEEELLLLLLLLLLLDGREKMEKVVLELVD